jgi:hypothetical protein
MHESADPSCASRTQGGERVGGVGGRHALGYPCLMQLTLAVLEEGRELRQEGQVALQVLFWGVWHVCVCVYRVSMTGFAHTPICGSQSCGKTKASRSIAFTPTHTHTQTHTQDASNHSTTRQPPHLPRYTHTHKHTHRHTHIYTYTYTYTYTRLVGLGLLHGQLPEDEGEEAVVVRLVAQGLQHPALVDRVPACVYVLCVCRDRHNVCVCACVVISIMGCVCTAPTSAAQMHLNTKTPHYQNTTQKTKASTTQARGGAKMRIRRHAPVLGEDGGHPLHPVPGLAAVLQRVVLRVEDERAPEDGPEDGVAKLWGEGGGGERERKCVCVW